MSSRNSVYLPSDWFHTSLRDDSIRAAHDSIHGCALIFASQNTGARISLEILATRTAGSKQAEGVGDIFSQKIFALRRHRRRNIVVDVCENFVRNSCYGNRRFEVVALVRVRHLHPRHPTHSPLCFAYLPLAIPRGEIFWRFEIVHTYREMKHSL